MPFVSREAQLANRPWDRFCPLKRIEPQQSGLVSLRLLSRLTDDLLDGITITRKDIAAHWINENTVHRAISLSDHVESTQYFLGAQVVATRDDIRQLSHFLVIEPDQLIRITTDLGQVQNKEIIKRGLIRRAHLTLDAFRGVLHSLYVCKQFDEYELYFDQHRIATASTDVDFPFMALSQAPKGRIPEAPPTYGLLSYKCRHLGKIYIRRVNGDLSLGDEIVLNTPKCLGGLDFAIHNNKVMFHIDADVGGRLVPMVASSEDEGRSISDFVPLDLLGFSPDVVIPTSCPIARDYHGNFHVPVATIKDGQQHFLDVHDGYAVEALVLKGTGFGHALLVFPKAPEKAVVNGVQAVGDLSGRGDGQTDGIGIIATTINDGKLVISNSQTGGFLYPPDRCVNHEMAQMFAFRATECCFTRAQNANMVSMDYVFIEANKDGDPLSTTLWLETWDMPLPTPQLTAKAEGNVVQVTILKDAWFELGKTTFKFSEPQIVTEEVRFLTNRKVEIRCNTDHLKGLTVSFDMQNFYYWHAGSAVIE